MRAPLPTPEAMRDPAERAEYLAAERRRSSTPGYRRAEAYIAWLDGPGACVPEGHRRLALSGALVVVAGLLGFAARRRARR